MLLSLNFILSYLIKKGQVIWFEKQLISVHNESIKFLKSNPNILFTKADKGNVTLNNKNEYITRLISSVFYLGNRAF